ncbi:uncharacterized protein [Diadema antillarum]|uniref:uncharacterized protein n=1 Tax=Diadema antillarum TaxID=105358 RepID=UPI003A83EDAD
MPATMLHPAISGICKTCTWHQLVLFFLALSIPAASLSGNVVINEIRLNTGDNTLSFVELHNVGSESFSVTNFTLALYNSSLVCAVITIPAVSLLGQAYYVIGSSELAVDLEWTESWGEDEDSGAIALYDGEGGGLDIGASPTTDFLQDAVVFAIHVSTNASVLQQNLAAETVFTQDDLYFPKQNLSINRCEKENEVAYEMVIPSPNATNDCAHPVVSSPLVISEVNANNPGEDDREYIELYNKANETVSLSDYAVVMYKGSTDRSYRIVHLTNKTIEPLGYYLIGSRGVQPAPQTILGPDRVINILQNKVSAVALYRGNTSQLVAGSNVTNASLVDAVVYDKHGSHDQHLVDTLTPGQMTVHEDSSVLLETDESISRCGGNDRLASSQFRVTSLTPGEENDCTTITVLPSSLLPHFPPINPDFLPRFIINEFRVQASAPFIELYDGGFGDVSLSDVVLVFYSGATLSVYVDPLPLSGYSTDENGWFVIGGEELEPSPDLVFPSLPAVEGCNAIALHLIELNRQIEMGNRASREGLLDVILYGEPRLPAEQELLRILTPGQKWLNPSNDSLSRSRCRGWDHFMQDAFTLADPSPGSLNTCPPPNVVINEINVVAKSLEGQYIELFDGGVGSQALNGLVLVLYDGEDDYAYQAIDLTGYSTNEAGFFVVGSLNGTNVDYIMANEEGFLHTGPDAIALHVGPLKYFRARLASSINLVDAVVYGTDDTPDLTLLHRLVPNQHHLNEVPSSTLSLDPSISRCTCCQRLNHTSFGTAPSSPGALNINCSQGNETFTETIPFYHQRIRINEVKFDDGDAATGGGGGFIEIYDGGFGGVDLHNIHVDLVTMNVNGDSHFLRFNLSGYQTNRKGYFVVQSPSPDLIPVVITNQTGASAVDQVFDHQMPLMLQSDAASVRLVSLATDTVIDVMTFGTNSTNDWLFLSSLDDDQPVINMDGSVFTEPPMPPKRDSLCRSRENGQASIDGETGLVHESLTLNGYKTDSHGLLLIGYQSLAVPRPDAPRFRRPSGWIPRGPGSARIYCGKKQLYQPGTAPSDSYLIDEVSYSNSSEPEDTDMSISRCSNRDGSITYLTVNVSPKGVNRCPARENAVLVINEVSLSPGQQFLELWDLGYGFTSLDEFVVVLFGDDDQSYYSYPLLGKRTNQAGYFVIGQNGVIPTPHLILDKDFLRTNYSAVALYRVSGTMSAASLNTPVTAELMDAVVYSDWYNGSMTSQSSALIPDASPIPTALLKSPSSSLSRCFSLTPRAMDPFVVAPVSADGLNDCPTFITDVIINEINVDIPGADLQEFIELYDGGRGNTSLDYTTLVLFNGRNSDRSYLAVGLDGYRTNAEGYFVIGSHIMEEEADLLLHAAPRGFLQNGPDAVALYRAHEGAFPPGTPVTEKSVIDAVVYSTNHKRANSLVDRLVPGYFIIKEDRTHLANDESLSRCHGLQRRDPTVYALTVPTVGKQNNCTAFVNFDSPFIINELRAIDGQPDKFVEIYDHGIGNTRLDNVMLVFLDGSNDDRSYLEINLSGRITNAQGFYVVGTADVSPPPDYVLTNSTIQSGSDAVVLYTGDPVDFLPEGNPGVDILDAVVYGSSMVMDTSLITSLAPGQTQVIQAPGTSVSRCISSQPMAMTAFLSTTPTPGAANNCTPPTIVINELSLENLGTPSWEFIELSDGGHGLTPLDSLILVLFTGINGGRAYKTIPLQGQKTDERGYFVIGSSLTSEPQLSQQPRFSNMRVGNLGSTLLQNGASAITLYRGDHRDYQPGMPPTTRGLVDVLVYGGDNDSTLFVRELLQGQSQVHRDPRFVVGLASLSRCKCCQVKMSSVFEVAATSPGRPNSCPSHPLSPDVPEVVLINEINPYNAATGGKEFVELKGVALAPLDGYILVIMEDILQISKVIYLSGKKLDSDGFLLIGAETVSPHPTLLFHNSENGTLKSSGGAVAIFRGQAAEFDVSSLVSFREILDAVPYSSPNSTAVQSLRVLTSAGTVFSYDSSNLSGEESISRCSCCEEQTTSAFMLSGPTPGRENLCPTSNYSHTVELRLLDAKFSQWRDSPEKMVAVREVVIQGIREECRCSFNSLYIGDEMLRNGSVIYEVTIMAVSPSQSSQLLDAYTSFVMHTTEVKVLGETYRIDHCVKNCEPDIKSPPKRRAIQSAAVIVGVTLTVILVIVTVAVASYFWRKRRFPVSRSSFTWFRKIDKMEGEFCVNSDCQLDDLDILSEVTNEDEFLNPIYGLSPPLHGPSYSRDDGDQNAPISVDLEVDTSISHA